MPTIRVGLAQINPVVGDLPGNVARIIAAMADAESRGCDVLALPELAVTGYPPEDLLLRPSFVRDNVAALDEVVAGSGRCVTIVGFVDPGADPGLIHNAAAVCAGGRLLGVYRKRKLPNYSVFDEQRYFAPGSDGLQLFAVAGVSVGVSICEDAWAADGPVDRLGKGGASLVVNINASPYNSGKAESRLRIVEARAAQSGATIAYVNQVGGQDELVFDGDSMVVAPDGAVLARAPRAIAVVTWSASAGSASVQARRR